MAIIGTFVADGDTFTGTLKTLTLNTKATLRSVEKESEKSPDFRLSTGDMDVGAGWKKTSREGRDYISAKLDDPSFPAPVYATLSETDTAKREAPPVASSQVGDWPVPDSSGVMVTSSPSSPTARWVPSQLW